MPSGARRAPGRSARTLLLFPRVNLAEPHTRPPRTLEDRFHAFSQAASVAVGRSRSFCLALAVVCVWGLSGPLFRFSDTWQLVINTGTTIVTFLMVFLIQNTQNRDAQAVHLKLDELIRANAHARNALLALESRSDAELEALQLEFEALRDRVKHVRKSRAP
jgi:low affinity Fe/Cu permease